MALPNPRRRRRRKTTRRRRRNPRAVGALVLNPRRRRRRRKTTRRRRRNMNYRSNTHRRRRRRTTRRRRRRNSLMVRTNPRHRRRRRRRRRAPRVIYRNPRRRRSRRRRRRRNLIGYRRVNRLRRRYNKGAMAGLKKIPLIGPILASMAGFIGPAAFGAIGVEPTMMVARLLGPYIPYFNSSLFYAIAGLGIAGVIGAYAPVSSGMKKQLATAVASAAGGVAYYKWRTGSDAEMETEISGLPSYGGLLGDGGPYAVVPFGSASGSLGEIEEYAGTTLGDVFVAPGALGALEIETALAGWGQWRRRFPPRGPRAAQRQLPRMPRGVPHPGPHAALPGGRWGWLIRWIGFDKFREIAAMPRHEQIEVIAELKKAAVEEAAEQIRSRAPEQADALGALIYTA